MLIEGITCGFKIVDDGSDALVKPAEIGNYRSATAEKTMVEQISVEIVQKHYQVTYGIPTFISALEAVKLSNETSVNKQVGAQLKNLPSTLNVSYSQLFETNWQRSK